MDIDDSSTDNHETNVSKRKRAVNFSTKEKELFYSLVDRYKSVLLSNNSTTDFFRLKRIAWKRITKEFNDAKLENIPRSTINLQHLMRSAKRQCTFEAPKDGELSKIRKYLEQKVTSFDPLDSGEMNGDSLADTVMSEETKRQRTANFTTSEKQLLIRLMRPHKKILMNQKCVKQVIRAKRAAWIQITNQFNNLSDQKVHRSTISLKNLFKTLRNTWQRKQNSIKVVNGSVQMNRNNAMPKNPWTNGHNSNSDVSDQDLNQIDYQCHDLDQTHNEKTKDLSNESSRPITRDEPPQDSDGLFPVQAFVRSPLILKKYERFLEAKINLDRAYLGTLHENIASRREREQEEFEFRNSIDDQLFTLKCEQDEEIHELTIAKLQLELDEMKKQIGQI